VFVASIEADEEEQKDLFAIVQLDTGGTGA